MSFVENLFSSLYMERSDMGISIKVWSNELKFHPNTHAHMH